VVSFLPKCARLAREVHLEQSILYKSIVTGLAAGVAAGLFGVGGGIVIVPILIYWFGMTQHAANGTSLVALLMPVGGFAVWNYHKSGKISGEQIQLGLFIGVGIAVGAYLGSQIAIGVNQVVLRKFFSVFLAIVAIKLWFQK